MQVFTDYPEVEYYGFFIDLETEDKLRKIAAEGVTTLANPFHVTLIHRMQKSFSAEQQALLNDFILEHLHWNFEMEVETFKYSPKGSMFTIKLPEELSYLNFIQPHMTSGVAEGYYPVQVPTLLARNYKKKAVNQKICVTLDYVVSQ